ncbi:hypothetical protein V8G54_036844 [Vigna mungo]|uniref:PB1-like domain-containing protein n=1 Tax=Vigna mungo TaxID=3915 RepID=A0AAQ3RGZ2_VIGMU
MANSDIEIVFHHGGKFENNRTFRYHSGKTTTLKIDPDRWSYFEILSILKEMDYRNVKELWYSLGRGPVLKDCLELLSDDKGACHLVNIALLNGEAHVYVIHSVCEPQYLVELEYFPEPQIERHSGQLEVQIECGKKQVEIKEEDVVMADIESEVVPDVEAEVKGHAEVEANGDRDIHVGVNVEAEVRAVGDVHGEVQGEVEAKAEPEVVTVGDVEGQVETEAEPEVEAVGDEEVEGEVQDDVQVDEYDDELTDHGDEVEFDIFEGTNQVQIGGPRGLSESDWESDTLNSVVESDNRDDDKDGYEDFGIFSKPKSMKQYKWIVGTGRLEKTIKENPSINLYNLQNKVSKKWNIGVSRSTTCRAKAMAFKQIEGDFKEQYKRLYDYANELLRSNPGSTIKLHAYYRFGRVFLKRKIYGGELLTAVTRDRNEQMCPLAYVVVEVENKDSWAWFLQLLIDDLGGVERRDSRYWFGDRSGDQCWWIFGGGAAVEDKARGRRQTKRLRLAASRNAAATNRNSQLRFTQTQNAVRAAYSALHPQKTSIANRTTVFVPPPFELRLFLTVVPLAVCTPKTINRKSNGGSRSTALGTAAPLNRTSNCGSKKNTNLEIGNKEIATVAAGEQEEEKEVRADESKKKKGVCRILCEMRQCYRGRLMGNRVIGGGAGRDLGGGGRNTLITHLLLRFVRPVSAHVRPDGSLRLFRLDLDI